MKKYLMIAVILLIGINQSALAQVKVCMSYDDFVAGNWTEVADLEPIHHSASHKLWVGGNDYKYRQ